MWECFRHADAGRCLDARWDAGFPRNMRGSRDPRWHRHTHASALLHTDWHRHFNMVQNVILVFFRRRLSQRPAVEELESRNILKREYRTCRIRCWRWPPLPLDSCLVAACWQTASPVCFNFIFSLTLYSPFFTPVWNWSTSIVII